MTFTEEHIRANRDYFIHKLSFSGAHVHFVHSIVSIRALN
jgi:hypothetical protein